MDFFAAQDRARRKTWQLIALFVTAVIALIVTTNLLVALVAAFSTTTGTAMGIRGALAAQSTGTWTLISAVVILVIAGASLSKYLVLRSGGRAIAEMLAARPIEPSSASTAERRLLNVVEEMAIASGIPVPAVYVVDEAAINAFAAGFSTDDAVIGVTSGTLEHLNRDELQGVIGHEFSHLLNGDSRINLRLIAILNGIIFLGVLGRLVLRSSTRGRRNSSGMPIIAMGLGLVVIGGAGTLCGNLIKAAVSRQREYLADAASVQFTRNPTGIANALKKIGGAPAGSILTHARAAEMSHMFFGAALRTRFGALLATHPALPERIRAIEPAWDGAYLQGAAADSDGELPAGISGFAPAARNIADAVGNPTAASVTTAQSLIGRMPPTITGAAHDPYAARALVYALLLAADGTVRRSQIMQLQARLPAQLSANVASMQTAAQDLDAMQRLTLISMSLPALKTMSAAQYTGFVADVLALVCADARIDLFEWVLHRVLLKSLKPHFEGPTRLRVRHNALGSVASQIAEMLSAIACA